MKNQRAPFSLWSGFGHWQVVDSTRELPALAAQTAAHANFLDAACSKFKLMKPFLYAQAVHLRFPAILIGVQTFQYPLFALLSAMLTHPRLTLSLSARPRRVPPGCHLAPFYCMIRRPPHSCTYISPPFRMTGSFQVRIFLSPLRTARTTYTGDAVLYTKPHWYALVPA